MNQLVLSTFTGIGMLDDGFRKNGFCVVSAGDLIYGQNIEDFRAVPNKFTGVIGGSPCQDFSRLRRIPPTGHGLKMLEQFKRIVQETNCDWFLHENVLGVPDIEIDGFHVIRFHLSPKEIGYSQSRNRKFQFGSKIGLLLEIEKKPFGGKVMQIATASEYNRKERRNWSDFCELQGLPKDFNLSEFSTTAKYKAVGNGVHLGVSFFVAKAIKKALLAENPKTIFNSKTCTCGCGTVVTGRKSTAFDSCRKRISNLRRKVSIQVETK